MLKVLYLISAYYFWGFRLEITIPLNVSLIGGVLSVLLFAVIIWLAFRAIQAALFWAALGGIPIFKITGTLFEMIMSGSSLSEIGSKVGISLIFFLKPLDDLISQPPEGYPWIKLPIAILMIIWLIMCIRWSSVTLASKWLYINEIWGIPIGVALWYVLTGTAEGFRTAIATMLPPLSPILLNAHGILIILISILAIIPISYIQYKRSQPL